MQKTESPFNLFGGGETQRQGQATGSGIVIDRNGTILTNYHVVENAIKVTVSLEKGKTVERAGRRQGPLQRPRRAAHPPRRPDAAPAHARQLEPAPRSATRCYAIGNPFDLERTLTTGVISALQRQITAPNGFTINNVLQTDAPINPGNSGGPLLDASGRVIGINSQIETGGSGGGSVGIGFAVPINTAKSEIAQLEKGGTVRGAYLGADLADDRRLAVGARTCRSKAARSCRACRRARRPKRPASKAAPSAAAPKAGRSRSAATSSPRSTARRSTSSEDLASDISAKKPGDTVTVGLLRGNGKGGYEHKTLSVKLAQPPELGAQREHSRRRGRTPLPLGGVPPTAPPRGEDLRASRTCTTPSWRSSWGRGRSG